MHIRYIYNLGTLAEMSEDARGEKESKQTILWCDYKGKACVNSGWCRIQQNGENDKDDVQTMYTYNNYLLNRIWSYPTIYWERNKRGVHTWDEKGNISNKQTNERETTISNYHSPQSSVYTGFPTKGAMGSWTI